MASVEWLASPAWLSPGPFFLLLSGTRMLVPQDRQRTVLPRAMAGTAKTFLQVRFGHMIRTGDSAIGLLRS